MTNKDVNKVTPQVSRIIKIATCPTCSGKATLTYHFGCSDDKQVYIRIVANSGGGLFSDEWVKLVDIQVALEGAPFHHAKLLQGYCSSNCQVSAHFINMFIKNEQKRSLS